MIPITAMNIDALDAPNLNFAFDPVKARRVSDQMHVLLMLFRLEHQIIFVRENRSIW